MKKIIILLFFTVLNHAFSQNGKIYLKNPKFKVGAPNTYVYEPPQGLTVPEKSRASIVYQFNYENRSESKDLTKKGKLYEFTLQTADPARTLLIIITNGQKVVDNNSENGYAVLLKTQNESELSKSLADVIYTKNYGSYFLKLKPDTKPETLAAAYAALFEKYPDLKNGKYYMSYLYQKDPADKEKTKSEFLAFAAKCIAQNTEESLMMASTIYSQNDMPEEKEKLDQEILTKYPGGQLEKSKFIQDYFKHPDKTEAYILENIEILKTKYKDSSKATLISLYHNLMLLYLDQKEYEKAVKIESHFFDPSGLYNQFAWELSGGDVTSPLKDGEFAAKISKRSLDIIEENKKEKYYPQYENLFNMYADTYALLLFKQGKYEEAFKYQEAVKAANGLDAGGRDRYLAILEKVKDTDEVKKYIEYEINTNEVTSPAFLSKLKEIYTAKNLDLAAYEKIKEKTDALAKAKMQQKVIDKFGSMAASVFALKNLEGKEIKLSDYKGKVVVLDFWATWCGPCRASFPKMQELVNQYKDKNVVFLFVDVWENGKEEDIFKNVTSFITEKKYSFNVVFDSKMEVAGHYKIKAIPTKIVIGKDGNILSPDTSDMEIASIIDNQLK